MDILIIGKSNVFLKRVLPALLITDKISLIHVASLSKENMSIIPISKRGKFYNSYSDALKYVTPTLVYISLPNSLHAKWVKSSLLAGFHVIIDKPAFLNYKQTVKMIELAKGKNLCLAEATVWPYHLQIKKTLELLTFENKINLIQSIFTIPKLNDSNFRYNLKMGGGCFNDMCAYAVSPGRVFFSELPQEINCRIIKPQSIFGIDTSFSITAYYSEFKIFQGFYGFDMEYKNTINLIGENFSILIEPAFTTSRDNMQKIIYKKNNVMEEIFIDPCDTFLEFIETVITSIECDNWQELSNNLLQDALVTEAAAKTSKYKRYVN